MSTGSDPQSAQNVRFDVVLACYNRRDLTLRALRSARRSADAAGVDADFTLFDDGSTDGTAEAVESLGFPVSVVRGQGDAFWAQGMARAEAAALQRFDARDAIVWLNDDVDVDEDAFTRLLEAMRHQPGAVHVGSTREPDGTVSYSGYRRAGRHPLRLRQVQPTKQQQPLDTFNGNLVLIPDLVRRAVGAIDGGFAHQLADIDYGYRVNRAGHEVLLEPDTFGTCTTNVPPVRLGALQDWQRFKSAKGGGHPTSMRRFLKRYAPVAWPLWMAQTYLLWWLRQGINSVRRTT